MIIVVVDDDDDSGDSTDLINVSGVTGYDQDPEDLSSWALMFEDNFEDDLSN